MVFIVLWVRKNNIFYIYQFSHSVVSDSLRPHESWHARPPCPSPTPRVHPNLCPLSRWCHTTISSSVVPFSSCPQSRPASESFPMSQLFTSGWASASAISPSKEYPGLIWVGLVGSPCSPRDSQESSPSPKKTYGWLTNTWKDAQHHPLLEKCKSRPQWGTTSHQSECLRSKSLQAINAGEGVEKREHSCTVGGNAN